VVADIAKLSMGREAYYTRELATPAAVAAQHSTPAGVRVCRYDDVSLRERFPERILGEPPGSN
jgi:hypothetical protein